MDQLTSLLITAAVVTAMPRMITSPDSSALALTWEDCGDADTHANVTNVGPASVPLGQTTAIYGTGQLDEDVSGGLFDLKMTGFLGVQLMHCSGDASQAQACKILGVEVVQFNGVSFPLSKGNLSITPFDIFLPSTMPSVAESTTTTLNVTSTTGEKILCVRVSTKAAAGNFSPAR